MTVSRFAFFVSSYEHTSVILLIFIKRSHSDKRVDYLWRDTSVIAKVHKHSVCVFAFLWKLNIWMSLFLRNIHRICFSVQFVHSIRERFTEVFHYKSHGTTAGLLVVRIPFGTVFPHILIIPDVLSDCLRS